MSGISGMLGMGGGASGSGFSAPSGVSQGQIDTSYNQTQSAIKQQNDFVKALAAQNGLGNQSNVFSQLQNVASGQGPNPAQAMLNQATGQNIAAQSALMAGQRGSSQNAGLIARQAAQQGGNLQQQAVGQGATMQANQSLNALNSMGNLANTQVSQQQAGLSGLNQYSLQQQGNLLGMQGNINTANAHLVGTSMGQQGNMLGNLTSGIGSIGGLFGGSSSSGSGGGSDMFVTPDTPIGGATEGGGASIGNYLSPVMDAEGGMVKRMADGGNISQPPSQMPMQNPSVQSQGISPDLSKGPQSFVGSYFKDTPEEQAAAPTKGGGGSNPLGGLGSMAGKAMSGLEHWGEHEALPYIEDFFGGMFDTAAGATQEVAGGAGDIISNAGEAAPAIGEGTAEVAPEVVATAAEGGMVPALVSKGEGYLDKKDVKKVQKGKNPLDVAKKIPGKPKYPGNDYRNDVVPKKLEEGGIVLPNSIMQSKHPHWEAHKFVSAILAKQGKLPQRKK